MHYCNNMSATVVQQARLRSRSLSLSVTHCPELPLGMAEAYVVSGSCLTRGAQFDAEGTVLAGTQLGEHVSTPLSFGVNGRYDRVDAECNGLPAYYNYYQNRVMYQMAGHSNWVISHPQHLADCEPRANVLLGSCISSWTWTSERERRPDWESREHDRM